VLYNFRSVEPLAAVAMRCPSVTTNPGYITDPLVGIFISVDAALTGVRMETIRSIKTITIKKCDSFISFNDKFMVFHFHSCRSGLPPGRQTLLSGSVKHPGS
jgi:hypothetical protein